MVTQAYSCTPLEAYRQPVPMVLEGLEARAFREAYEAVEEWDRREQDKEPHPPRGVMVDRVEECRREKARRVIDERRARGL